MLWTQVVCPPSSQQNQLGKFALSSELFPFHQKDNWVFFWTFFSINEFVFGLCCLRLFWYKVGHHAISHQKHRIQHRVISSVCTDGQTDGHVTIMSLPKFLGLIGYQICLALALREGDIPWRVHRKWGQIVRELWSCFFHILRIQDTYLITKCEIGFATTKNNWMVFTRKKYPRQKGHQRYFCDENQDSLLSYVENIGLSQFVCIILWLGGGVPCETGRGCSSFDL